MRLSSLDEFNEWLHDISSEDLPRNPIRKSEIVAKELVIGVACGFWENGVANRGMSYGAGVNCLWDRGVGKDKLTEYGERRIGDKYAVDAMINLLVSGSFLTPNEPTEWKTRFSISEKAVSLLDEPTMWKRFNSNAPSWGVIVAFLLGLFSVRHDIANIINWIIQSFLG